MLMATSWRTFETHHAEKERPSLDNLEIASAFASSSNRTQQKGKEGSFSSGANLSLSLIIRPTGGGACKVAHLYVSFIFPGRAPLLGDGPPRTTGPGSGRRYDQLINPNNASSLAGWGQVQMALKIIIVRAHALTMVTSRWLRLAVIRTGFGAKFVEDLTSF